MKGVESRANLAGFVGRPRVNEDSLCFVRDLLEELWVVARNHDVAVLVSLLCDDAVFQDGNGRALGGAEADGAHFCPRSPPATRCGHSLARIVEALAIAHQYDCAVARRLV